MCSCVFVLGENSTRVDRFSFSVVDTSNTLGDSARKVETIETDTKEFEEVSEGINQSDGDHEVDDTFESIGFLAARVLAAARKKGGRSKGKLLPPSHAQSMQGGVTMESDSNRGETQGNRRRVRERLMSGRACVSDADDTARY